jgi:hypothetical protein
MTGLCILVDEGLINMWKVVRAMVVEEGELGASW